MLTQEQRFADAPVVRIRFYRQSSMDVRDYEWMNLPGLNLYAHGRIWQNGQEYSRTCIQHPFTLVWHAKVFDDPTDSYERCLMPHGRVVP